MLSGENLAERLDGLLEGNEATLDSSAARPSVSVRGSETNGDLQDLGDGERLGHETLDLTRTLDLESANGCVSSLVGRTGSRERGRTVSLSSSESSSIPRMAMISWRPL